MTAEDLMEKMSVNEFHHWIAYYNIKAEAQNGS